MGRCCDPDAHILCECTGVTRKSLGDKEWRALELKMKAGGVRSLEQQWGSELSGSSFRPHDTGCVLHVCMSSCV